MSGVHWIYSRRLRAKLADRHRPSCPALQGATPPLGHRLRSASCRRHDGHRQHVHGGFNHLGVHALMCLRWLTAAEGGAPSGRTSASKRDEGRQASGKRSGLECRRTRAWQNDDKSGLLELGVVRGGVMRRERRAVEVERVRVGMFDQSHTDLHVIEKQPRGPLRWGRLPL